uniref:Uncharacterized protein n=1 Tax=Cucumis melo TaxID=3656 RepID=A0A9I9DTW5_CUCME
MLKENELNVLQDLDRAKKTIKKLTIGIQRLDKIIEVGKSYGDKRGLDYIDESSTPSSSKTKFAKAKHLLLCLSLICLMMCLIMLDLALYRHVIIVVLNVTLDLNALN